VSIKKRPVGGWTVAVKGKGSGLSLDCDLLIGCDGPSSLVRRSSGIGPPKETITGVSIEANAYPGGPPNDRIGMFTGRKVAKGFFAWTIPSSGKNGLRLGVSSIDPGGLMDGLRTLMNDRRLAEFLSIDGPEDLRLAETSMTLGTIPMGSPDRTVLKDLVLIGDSAGMAKPTSGGGIYPALRAVDLLSSIVEGRGELSPSVISEFGKAWKKGYGSELERAFVARRILSDISDEELDLALGRLSRKETLEIINSEGDIDQPMALAISLVKRDPGLLMLLPRFLPHLKKVL
jgi:flavin-dependent dehydrogenase